MESFDFLQESDCNEQDLSIWDLIKDSNQITQKDSEEILGFIGESFEKLVQDEISFRQKFSKSNLNFFLNRKSIKRDFKNFILLFFFHKNNNIKTLKIEILKKYCLR